MQAMRLVMSFFVIDRLHVVGFDQSEHGRQLLDLFQRQRRYQCHAPRSAATPW